MFLLHDRDGRIWQINAYVPPGESATKPARLVINCRALVRVDEQTTFDDYRRKR